MNTVTIYTAVTPGYDSQKATPPKEQGVAFEFRKGAGESGSLESVLWNRKQKILEPPTDCLTSLYVDGSFTIMKPVKELVEGWLEKHDMALFKHPWRECAYAEIDECVARGKLDARAAEKARSHLMLAGFPRDYGLWACGIISRRAQSNPLQQWVAPQWFKLVQEVPRDQIWLPYVLWMHLGARERVKTIDKDIYKTTTFKFKSHQR